MNQEATQKALQEKDVAELDCLRSFREIIEILNMNYDTRRKFHEIVCYINNWDLEDNEAEETSQYIIDNAAASIKSLDSAHNNFLETLKSNSRSSPLTVINNAELDNKIETMEKT